MRAWTQLDLFTPEAREETREVPGYVNTNTHVQRAEVVPPVPGAGHSDAPEHTRHGSAT